MLYLNTIIKSINIAPFNLETKSVTKFYEIVVSFFHKISFFSQIDVPENSQRFPIFVRQ